MNQINLAHVFLRKSPWILHQFKSEILLSNLFFYNVPFHRACILLLYKQEEFYRNEAKGSFSIFPDQEYAHCKEIWIYVFPGKEFRGLSPNFHIHVSVSDLFIPAFSPPIFLQQNRQTYQRNIWITHRNMNVGIGTGSRAVTLLGIFVSDFLYCVFAVQCQHLTGNTVDHLKILSHHNLCGHVILLVWCKNV